MVFKNPVTNNSIDHTLSAVRDLKIHLSRNFKKKSNQDDHDFNRDLLKEARRFESALLRNWDAKYDLDKSTMNESCRSNFSKVSEVGMSKFPSYEDYKNNPGFHAELAQLQSQEFIAKLMQITKTPHRVLARRLKWPVSRVRDILQDQEITINTLGIIAHALGYTIEFKHKKIK